MLADILRIAIVLIVGWGLWALNDALVSFPKAKQIIGIIIIVCGCLFLIAPLVDLVQLALNSAKSAGR